MQTVTKTHDLQTLVLRLQDIMYDELYIAKDKGKPLTGDKPYELANEILTELIVAPIPSWDLPKYFEQNKELQELKINPFEYCNYEQFQRKLIIQYLETAIHGYIRKFEFID